MLNNYVCQKPTGNLIKSVSMFVKFSLSVFSFLQLSARSLLFYSKWRSEKSCWCEHLIEGFKLHL